ncbi:hypothetical protein MMC17_000797 [Xylographa soralifera]|nr:hypothetical protein [Xylographa soralifera]
MGPVQPLDLAPELLFHIFLSFDSLRDVSHLAAASQTLREVFMSNAHSIYSEVAPRHTPLFDEAQALLDAQDQKAISQGEQPPSNANEAAALRMIRLGLNERILLKFTKSFVDDCFRFGMRKSQLPLVKTRRPPSLTVTEVIRFEHAYYGLWTLIEHMSTTPETLLAATTLREFVRLSDVMLWVCSRFSKHDTKHQPFAYKKWEKLHELFREAVKERNMDFIAMPDQDSDKLPIPSWIPWSVWDQYQEDYIDKIPDTA